MNIKRPFPIPKTALTHRPFDPFVNPRNKKREKRDKKVSRLSHHRPDLPRLREDVSSPLPSWPRVSLRNSKPLKLPTLNKQVKHSAGELLLEKH